MSGRVLLIGGIDSSGGAGLLRDCSSVAELGGVGQVAVTAVTAQDDRQVAQSQPMSPLLVARQMRLAFQSGVQAVKIGMLANAAIVRMVAQTLPPIPVVLDPVLQATSGRDLLDAAGQVALLRHLLPKVSLLTPNVPELAALGRALQLPLAAAEPVIVQALMQCGTAAVLVKGGHRPDHAQAEDRLYRPGEAVLSITLPRRPGHLRGTGCQLASGIATGLAQGLDLPAAIHQAKAQVDRRFQAALA